MARWSAQRRGGLYIEPEDLLHALIRDDRGEWAAIFDAVFPGAEVSSDVSAGDHRPFFADSMARTLLKELQEQPDRLVMETSGEKYEPVPHVDMPVSNSLKQILALVARTHQNDGKIIEPLDLLAGIVGTDDNRPAQLLRDCGITVENVTKALAQDL